MKSIQVVFIGLALLISGFGVGWLVGLSTSPVVGTVITSVITLLIGVTSILANIKTESGTAESMLSKSSITPYSLAVIVVGLAIGASVGTIARTNNWLGPNAITYINQWKATGLNGKEISRRVFDSLFPVGASATPNRGGVLFDVSSDNCSRFRAARDNRLEVEINSSSDSNVREVSQICTNNIACLRKFVEKICSQQK